VAKSSGQYLVPHVAALLPRKRQDGQSGGRRMGSEVHVPDGKKTMDFRLIYQGPLHAQSGGSGGGRLKEKHLIRREFHKQLQELWQQHPDLRSQANAVFTITITPHNMVSPPGPGVRQIMPAMAGEPNVKTWLEHIADDHRYCGGRFVPLISKQGGFTCSLDILFLRKHKPGSLIASGGDIDNRLKVLFDALKMPKVQSDLGGLPLETDENPFFCLLEDDSLITSLSVTTDRLLTPQAGSDTEVFLVIHVTMVNPSAVFAGNRLV
jgi:hypothetical protein